MHAGAEIAARPTGSVRVPLGGTRIGDAERTRWKRRRGARMNDRPSTYDAVPERWDDITADWLTNALQRHHPGARIAAVRIVDRDDGTNRRVRLELSYAAGHGPATLFLKANDPAHRSVHLRNGNLFNEAQLFSSDMPLAVDHPVVYKSIVDRAGGNFLLVMEDLVARNADPRDATRPMTSEQVAKGLRGLARLHSRYWGVSDQSHPALSWVQTWAPSDG
ncbi:MAG: hypothetical protein ACLGI7_13545, partial [Gammaproteobacteria bacterium]